MQAVLVGDATVSEAAECAPPIEARRPDPMSSVRDNGVPFLRRRLFSQKNTGSLMSVFLGGNPRFSGSSRTKT